MANEKAKEKPAAAAEAAGGGEAAPKKGGGMMKMMIAGGVVVLLEVATVFVTVKMSSGPKQVIAEVPAVATTEAVVHDAEVKIVLDKKLPNRKSGKLYLYDLQVVAKTDEKNRTKLEEMFKDHEGEIKDRIRTIIASTDVQTLQEPGLETLRRQIQYQLEQDLGKDLVKEVLIPTCTPIPGEF